MAPTAPAGTYMIPAECIKPMERPKRPVTYAWCDTCGHVVKSGRMCPAAELAELTGAGRKPTSAKGVD